MDSTDERGLSMRAAHGRKDRAGDSYSKNHTNVTGGSPRQCLDGALEPSPSSCCCWVLQRSQYRSQPCQSRPAGLLFTIQPPLTVVFSPLARATSDQIGTRWPATLEMALLALGTFLLSRLGPTSSLFYIEGAFNDMAFGLRRQIVRTRYVE